jgi:hypothetical protein
MVVELYDLGAHLYCCLHGNHQASLASDPLLSIFQSRMMIAMTATMEQFPAILEICICLQKKTTANINHLQRRRQCPKAEQEYPN